MSMKFEAGRTLVNSSRTSDVSAIEAVTETYQPLVSLHVMWHLNVHIAVVLCTVIALGGTVTNAMNMKIFYVLGIKDSMKVSLFVLSVTDFLLSCVVTGDRVFYAWGIVYSGEGIDPRSLSYAGFSFLADTLFLCSGWVLTFMSIHRCVCVIFPFKVKQIFTMTRTIVVIVIIYLLIFAASLVPIYATQWMGWVDIEEDNGTTTKRRMVVIFSKNRKLVYDYVSIFSSILIPSPSLVIIFISVLWMSYGLAVSSRQRDSMTVTSKDTRGKNLDSSMTQKTRTLVKVVLVLAIIFLICSIPRIVGYCLPLFLPELSEAKKERQLNSFIWQLARLTSTFNAFVNIFVYLKINTSYREKFRELILRKETLS